MDDEIKGLTKVSVNLTPRAYQALEDAAAITGDNRTDTINRALQVYLLLVGNRHIGERLFVGRRRWRARELVIDWFNEGGRRRG